MTDLYPADQPMRDARARYFAANHFGDDGGYADAWVTIKLGPVPLAIPNTEGRLRAVRYHDLHHIVTGYATDIHGEFEISAWEIGAGCRDFYAAWLLNLAGMAGGALACPGRTFRAFVRGTAMHTLYGADLEVLLSSPVGDVRARSTRSEAPKNTTIVTFLAFLAAALSGVVIGTLLAALGVVLAPVLLLLGAHKRVVTPV